MNVICYGDSNTYGYDPRSYFGDRYPSEARWVDILARKTGWYIQNEGLNGRDIPVEHVYVPENTDLFVVMLGTNDLLQGRSVAQISKRMELFLRSLPLERDKILLVSPPAMVPGEWVQQKNLIDASLQFSEAYRSLAKLMAIRFADAQCWRVGIGFDGVHFTETGHRTFAAGLYEEISRGEL